MSNILGGPLMIFRKLRQSSKILIIIVVVAFALGGTLWGLTGVFGPDQDYPQAQMDQGIVGDMDLEETLFSVNDEEVPVWEFVQVLQQYTSQLQGLPEHQIVDFQNEILQYFIQQVVALQEAQRRGIEVEISDEEVEEIVEGYLADMGMTEEQFESQLSAQGISMEEMREDIRHALWERELMFALEDDIRAEIEISDEEIREQYEQVQARNIFVKFSEHDEEDALAIIQKAKEEIDQGRSFEEVAAEYSDSELGEKRGGDLGTIQRGDYLHEKVIETAFTISEGEVSDIFKTDSGYHLVKVEEKLMADEESEHYQMERQQIEAELWEERSQAHYNEYIDTLVTEAEIEIYDPLLAGYYWLSRGEHDRAMGKIEEAQEEDPENPLLYNLLAQAFIRAEDKDRARNVYEQATEKFPKNWELNFAFADLLRQMEDYDAAVEQLDRVVEMREDDYYTMLQTLRMLEGMQREEEASEVREIVQQLEHDLGYRTSDPVEEEQLDDLEMIEEPIE